MDFGDKSEVKNVTGYDKAKTFTHTYNTKGIYTITASASNKEGSATASALLYVEGMF